MEIFWRVFETIFWGCLRGLENATAGHHPAHLTVDLWTKYKLDGSEKSNRREQLNIPWWLFHFFPDRSMCILDFHRIPLSTVWQRRCHTRHPRIGWRIKYVSICMEKTDSASAWFLIFRLGTTQAKNGVQCRAKSKKLHFLISVVQQREAEWCWNTKAEPVAVKICVGKNLC